MAIYPEIQFLTGELSSEISVVNEPAQSSELRVANKVRKRFFQDKNRSPYMVDIVRAFRLARGAKSYIEVGTRDKGNLAWVAQHLLDKDATIVDVDLENDIEAESRVRAELDSGKNYHCIEGNSISDEVLERVRGVFPKPEVDLIFLDSNHMYFHFLNEVDRYLPLLKPGGFLLAHDVCWEGSEKQKGKAQACELIDRHLPIFLVNGNAPVTRFMRLQKNDPSWGCVGIIQKPYEVSK